MSEIVKCTSAAERRQEMLDPTLGAVKKRQVRFGGKVELATEENEKVLCTKLEMKVSTPSLGMAVIKNVKDLVLNNFDSTENGGVWRIMKTILNKHEYAAPSPRAYAKVSTVTTATVTERVTRNKAASFH